MLDYVLNSFKGEIFDFKVEQQGLISGTVVFFLVFGPKMEESGE